MLRRTVLDRVRVRWSLAEPDRAWLTTVLGDADTATVSYAADSYGDSTDIVGEGIVKAIREVHCEPASKPGRSSRSFRLVEAVTTLREVGNADGWPDPVDGLRFVGYVVSVDW